MSLLGINRTSFSLGALIALIVLILTIVLGATGNVSPFFLLVLVGLLALALLIG